MFTVIVNDSSQETVEARIFPCISNKQKCHFKKALILHTALFIKLCFQRTSFAIARRIQPGIYSMCLL